LVDAMSWMSARMLPVSVQADMSEANVKPQGGRSQNGQPVEFGQPLFVIG